MADPQRPNGSRRPAQEIPPGPAHDFALLPQQAYGDYFRLLTRAWQLLLASYRNPNGDSAGDSARSSNESAFPPPPAAREAGTTEAGNTEPSNYEARAVAGYLERLLYTVGVLGMKYAYTSFEQRLPWIDVSDSGFPNAQEISMLGVDLLRRDARLRELPTAAMLKSLALDHMFAHQQEPRRLLWQLAQRNYLKLLDAEKLFLSFTTDLETTGPERRRGRELVRTYATSWGCYDFRSNRPYLHVMTFEQDLDEEPIEQRGPSHLRLLEVLEAEGSRAPDVGVLAMAIDDALEYIHPKVVKRIGIGPLYAPLLLRHEALEQHDPATTDPATAPDEARRRAVHRELLELLERHGSHDDFVLHVTDEIVFSKRQQVTRSIFAPGGRVREVFHIPESEPESYRRRASVVHHHLLLPHALGQHLDRETLTRLGLAGARLLTFDADGVVHGR